MQNDNLTKELTRIYSKSYPEFVKSLSRLPDDDKIKIFLKNNNLHKEENKFNVNRKIIPAINLRPTQNEIDISKSLKYPLSNENECYSIISETPMKLGSNDVLTFNEREIIDGHHRWSQVFVINPNCPIITTDLKKNDIDPLSVLKATETAVYASTGKIETQTVTGRNLLEANKEQIFDYVTSNIVKKVFDVFQHLLNHNTIQETAEYIWENCELMQNKNKPIHNAPQRSIMPQTDDSFSNIIDLLKNGEINIMEAREMKKLIELLESYTCKNIVLM